jgi:putative nucleotidyltransferase with HDIG domain
MDAFPSNPSVAMRVLWIADDPRATAPLLANTLEQDPALTARVLRIANSAYFSPGTRVTNVPRAVVTVGFATVRALAAGAVTGLDDGQRLPERFWEHSAEVAHATGLVARHFGVGANDGFAAGLLHDLGEGIMCRTAPDVWAEVAEATATDTPERLEVERERFGADHAEVAERILRAWHLPESLSDAVRSHHLPHPSNALGRALSCGSAFAAIVCEDLDEQQVEAAMAHLDAEGITADFVERVGPRLAEETAALAESFR